MAEVGDDPGAEFNDFNGYIYWCRYRHNNISYLKCKEEITKQCPGSGKEEEQQFTLTREHNHPPNPEHIVIQLFKNELHGAVTSSLKDFRIIYDEISLLHPRGAVLVPFKSVERSMLRWRRTHCPPIPHSLVEYTNIVNMERWKDFRHYNGGNLSITCIRAVDNSHITIFADRRFLQMLQIEEVYIDATFKVCPRDPIVRQFLTIMGRINDAVIPIAWALMESKSMQAYLDLFRYFSLTLAPTLQPRIIMTDFEIALTSALQAVYPNAEIVHCFFHYCQALTKRLIARGQAYKEHLDGWTQGKKFVRKVMALALLPAEQIPPAFHWLVDNAAADILEFFRNLINYFSNWWLLRVTPPKFSVFNKSHRTNNVVEAYHRVLRQRMGDHPSIWSFTDHIRILQNATRIEYMSLKLGLSIRRNPEKQYVVQEAVLQKAWELLINGSFDVPKFLACANHFLRAFGNNLLIQSTEEVEYFATAQSHDIALRPIGEAINAIILPEGMLGFPILTRDMGPEGRVEILLLRNITASRCPTCNRSIVDIACLPCRHWYCCRNCVQEFIALATREDAQLRCRICMSLILAFEKMHVT